MIPTSCTFWRSRRPIDMHSWNILEFVNFELVLFIFLYIKLENNLFVTVVTSLGWTVRFPRPFREMSSDLLASLEKLVRLDLKISENILIWMSELLICVIWVELWDYSSGGVLLSSALQIRRHNTLSLYYYGAIATLFSLVEPNV